MGKVAYLINSYLRNMEDSKICIFLTGTIAPSDEVINLVHNDAKKREGEYYEAICKWICLKYPIVFCENSGYRSEKLAKLFISNPNCEYLQFESTANSKSEGEAEIFQYGFTHSKLLNQSEVIVKASGRYTIKNANTIINSILNSSNLKCVDIWCDLSKNLSFSDSRFFVFKPGFYRNYLEGHFRYIDENNAILFETCLARGVHSCLADGNGWLFLPQPIICKGIYGTEGIKFKNDIFRILKRSCFFYAKKIAFNL